MKAEGIVSSKRASKSAKTSPPKQLKKDYDAVVLCIGSKRPRDLECSRAATAGGIHFRRRFSRREHKKPLRLRTSKDGKYISAKDKDVIVIGGGDTGTDCVAHVDSPRLQERHSV